MLRRLPLGIAALSIATLLPLASASAAPSASAQLRARRVALSRAMSRRDSGAVAKFHSPKFVSRGRDGKAISYQEYFSNLADGLQSLPGFRQTVVIDRISVNGTRGTLWVRTTDRFKETPRKTVTVRGKLRETWQRQRGKWLLTEARQL
jgi:hypothetical protein